MSEAIPYCWQAIGLDEDIMAQSDALTLTVKGKNKKRTFPNSTPPLPMRGGMAPTIAPAHVLTIVNLFMGV